MRNRYRRAAFAIAVSLAFPAAGWADGVIAMRYSCAVIDGKPKLTPSQMQAHRIIGPRESRTVDTCSTIDTERCRRWAVEKFEMACGTSRVSWMEVFANATEHTRRRVWETNGRLRVRNTAMRPKRLDDICARRMPSNLEWSSTSEICEEAARVEAPTAIEIPAGFAPTLGLRTTFITEQEAADHDIEVAAAPPVPEPVPALAPAARAPPVAAVAPASDLPRESAGASQAPATADVDATPSAITSPASPPEDTTSTQALATPEPEAGDAARALAAVRSPTAETPPTSVANVPSAPASLAPEPAPAQQAPPPALSDTSAAAEERAPAAADVVVLNRTEPPAPPTPEAPMVTGSVEAQDIAADSPPDPHLAAAGDGARDGSTIATLEPGSTVSDPWRVVTYAAMTLASLLLIAALLAAHWFRRVVNAPAHEQAAQVPTDMAHPAPLAPTAVAGRELVLADNGGRALLAPTASGNTAALGLCDRVPATKLEALALLGMGIASDSSVSSIKKVIDGLRMSWHPDLARDEADRQAREVRLRQINAAWEILGGKTADA